jgi:gliding motility-associated-like protein
LVSCATYSFQFNVDLPTLQLNNTYLWDFGDGSTSSSRIAQHSFPSSGSYKVKLAIVTTSCTINYEDIIIVEKEPVLVLDKLPKFCEGDSVVVHVSGANSYIWNAGSQSDSLTISREGTYTVTGVSKTGCTTTMKFNASYFDLYNYNIETDQSQVVFEGTPLKIWSKDVPLSQYFWDFGDGTKESGNDLTHVYSPSNAGFFDIKLQVVNPNGCLEKTSMRIWVASPALANTFSPNGDGKNDVFMKDWHIKVYNRNGILISDGFGWDGNYKGKQVANDTYFFVLYYSTDSGMKAKSGYVTLIR